jgi:hypothetical protein
MVAMSHVLAEATRDLVEVDQPSHRHVDRLGSRELAQRRRRAPFERHHQRDGAVVGSQDIETTLAVRTRGIDEDQRSRHDQGFIHAGRVRAQGFVMLAAR